MARSAIYSLISLGIRNIFICNRTLSKATALAEHYNNLIDTGALPELGSESVTKTRVRVLDTFISNWPSDVRQPTIVVCCVPRQAASEPPTNFSLPEHWLKSATGGVVLEVKPPASMQKANVDKESRSHIDNRSLHSLVR